MKHIFNKNVLALLILGSAGLSVGAQAAPVTKDITITATVAADITFDVISDKMEFKDFKTGATVTQKIKFKGNSKANVKVTVKPESMEGGKFALQEEGEGATGKAKVDVKLGGKLIDASSGEAEITSVAPGADTELALSAVADQNLKAGNYKGVLTVSIEAV